MTGENEQPRRAPPAMLREPPCHAAHTPSVMLRAVAASSNACRTL